MSEKKSLRKGEAKVQFIACQERVEELAKAGYGPVRIYEILKKEKRVTMSYGGFYEAYRYGEVRKKQRRDSFKNSEHSIPAYTQASPIGHKPNKSKNSGQELRLAALEAAVKQRNSNSPQPALKQADESEYSKDEVI